MIRPGPLMLGEWGSAGLRPAPAVVPAAGRQPQQQQPFSCEEAGWVRLWGTLQVRPCKLGRRIHAAHAPTTGPTPPSTAPSGGQ
ncbi:hypothetical protein EGM71_02195 [Stenotrophomonas maltophilia]|nr:hypothetical protein EGM71_02195 [Stenotrophomonas maltophilia]